MGCVNRSSDNTPLVLSEGRGLLGECSSKSEGNLVALSFGHVAIPSCDSSSDARRKWIKGVPRGAALVCDTSNTGGVWRDRWQ